MATGDRATGDRAAEYESAHQATLPQAGRHTAAPVVDQIANQRYLTLALTPVRDALQQFVAHSATPATPLAEPDSPIAPTPDSTSAFALDTLCALFQLSEFERSLLLLCAGVELSGSLAHLCATAQGAPHLSYPTFSLALAALPAAHWSALTPVAPLRYWRLIEVLEGNSLTQSRLRIDERVLHYLTGVSYLDDRLQGLIAPLALSAGLPPSHQRLAEQVAAFWSDPASSSVVQICGENGVGKQAIAAHACALSGLQLHILRAADVPSAMAERTALIRLWEREALLSHSALLITYEGLERGEQILPLIETIQSRVAIAGREPLEMRRPSWRLDVSRPSTREQRYLWQQQLAPLNAESQSQAEANAESIEVLVSQFNLNAATIQSVSQSVSQSVDHSPEAIAPLLWDTCRIQSRSRMADLAQRISPSATWQDLVLPTSEQQILEEITAQVRHRAKVYDTWEFGGHSPNGLGITALFSGASGTGKTLAAEVLAQELRLDLYRIDLSQTVSKYIGDTEKNLRRVFDAAEMGGAILLFDEADALFGKRSEVKDSHDRYANIEVSYLLQRMEAYRGLAILTTNLKQAIDTAFLRRLRFVVQFPFPDWAQRLEIWRHILPENLPTQDLDFQKLAQLNVAGGHIRNIALNAAFLAADADTPMQMVHLLRAAQREYAKLEKPLTDVEIGGWV
ncbi:MAG: ATP-binding protein [Oscillatoriophycideae cyanobacterium NC_groundwater_1537_Pr4_S-0.65um_50_18]|nr:ATP-binding protein [Oscillatoriophycideae cyanobacterium NC_groundwater_1537_Pr4_S-0.65um_50_18]